MPPALAVTSSVKSSCSLRLWGHGDALWVSLSGTDFGVQVQKEHSHYREAPPALRWNAHSPPLASGWPVTCFGQQNTAFKWGHASSEPKPRGLAQIPPLQVVFLCLGHCHKTMPSLGWETIRTKSPQPKKPSKKPINSNALLLCIILHFLKHFPVFNHIWSSWQP